MIKYRQPKPPCGGTSATVASAMSSMLTFSSVGAVSQTTVVILEPSAEKEKVMDSKG